MLKNKVQLLFALIAVAIMSQSCEKYLEEDFRSGAATDVFFATEPGLESLVGAAYVSTRIWYGQEEGLDMTDIGTDQYSWGPEHPNPELFTYTAAFDAQRGRLITLFVELYKGVNSCNEALSYLAQEDHPMPAAQRELRTAEMLFMRAFYYWHLVETFGDVPLKITHTASPVTTALRNSQYEIYDQMMQDLNASIAYFEANPNANSSDNDMGRVNLHAGYAFRARLALTIGSYMSTGDEFGFANGLPTNEGAPFSYNSATEWLNLAKSDAETLITSGEYSFYDSFVDTWELANNSSSRNNEAIWHINYSREVSAQMNIPDSEFDPYYTGGQKPWSDRDGGDVRHLMFGMRYDVLPGMHRDLENGRPFRRYFPLKYLVESFDDADDRWEGQFQLVYVSNNDTTDIEPSALTSPVWQEFDLPAGFTIPKDYADFQFEKDTTPDDGKNNKVKFLANHIYRLGDTAAIISREDLDNSRLAPAKAWSNLTGFYIDVDRKCLVWDKEMLYDTVSANAISSPAGYMINTDGSWNREAFFKLKKFDDPERDAANGTGSQRGIRDVMVFRLAEMTLIAAEADWRLGDGGSAYNHLLALAETRSSTLSGSELLARYGINGGGDLDLEFFLDERAREFVGEHYRWFDLKRVFNRSDWVNYIRSKNPDAGLIQEFHYIRPVPQIVLDALENGAEFGGTPGYQYN